MNHLHRATLVALRACSLVFVLSLCFAAPALADHEPHRIGLAAIGQGGPFFRVEMQPGESRDLEVELSNRGHTGVVARTYPADAYSIVNGGLGAELFGEDASGTTLWLGYPTREISLPPDQALVIEFTVSVPEDTPPGEYITAIVAENAEPYSDTDGDDGLQFEQVNRTAIAVAIDVPGPRMASLEIGAVGHKAAAGMSFVTFEILNTGNVHLKPAGDFVLRDAAGEPIATYEPAMDSVYAGTETLLEAPLSNELLPGSYCAELSLADETNGVRAASECLPIVVDDPDAGEDDAAGSDGQTFPPVQPMIDAAGDNPRLLGGGLILLAAVGGIALLRSRAKRLSRARRVRPG